MTDWILTADERVARLLRLDRTTTGRLHVSAVDEIEDLFEGHEHRRPSPRSAKTGHTYASEGHADEALRHRFAKEVAVWLERQAEELAVERVTVFAAPKFLGALREAWTPRFAMSVDESPLGLTNVPIPELVKHEAITSLADRA